MILRDHTPKLEPFRWIKIQSRAELNKVGESSGKCFKIRLLNLVHVTVFFDFHICLNN